MKFHVEFTYGTANREKLLKFFHSGGLFGDGPVKITGAWISIQTGNGFALIETKDGKAFFELCSSWSEYGQIKVTPVIDAATA
jgi:hypothetical protein